MLMIGCVMSAMQAGRQRCGIEQGHARQGALSALARSSRAYRGPVSSCMQLTQDQSTGAEAVAARSKPHIGPGQARASD